MPMGIIATELDSLTEVGSVCPERDSNPHALSDSGF